MESEPLSSSELFGGARVSYPRHIKFMQALMRDDTDEK